MLVPKHTPRLGVIDDRSLTFKLQGQYSRTPAVVLLRCVPRNGGEGLQFSAMHQGVPHGGIEPPSARGALPTKEGCRGVGGCPGLRFAEVAQLRVRPLLERTRPQGQSLLQADIQATECRPPRRWFYYVITLLLLVAKIPWLLGGPKASQPPHGTARFLSWQKRLSDLDFCPTSFVTWWCPA